MRFDTLNDFSKIFIGLEPIMKKFTDLTESTINMSKNFPPYNIKKISETKYVLEVALAGFGKQDIDIEMVDDVLTVKGKHETQNENDYIFHGIANRAFTRSWTVSDTVKVENAEFINGILKIVLDNLIPEKKSHKIDINDGSADTSELLNEKKGI